MDTAECSVVSALPVPVPVPSTTSTISTSASATPTGLLSQEMTGCEISNAASLGFTKGTNMISLSNVYTTKFYFKPEVSGTYVFSFSSTNYEPKLLVGSFGFDCCSKNDEQGLGNSYSSADSKEFYLEAGVYYPMKVLGTGGRPSLAASKSGVAILISDFQWYTPDNLDTAECSVVSALPVPSTTSTTRTSASATPIPTLAQEMTSCSIIENGNNLLNAMGESQTLSEDIMVYEAAFYFRPEEPGTYMFKFPSAEYNPKLFIGEQAFEGRSIL
ncbi:hypothetical protein B5S30_g5603 [[Candida] boidinii]|nr:hypothetical protein B5S30_g5603 [[Candida] boidinii]